MLGKLGRQLQECTLSFQPHGVSSKINALLANVEKTNKNDKRSGIFASSSNSLFSMLRLLSIIFSGWTRTLDLIEQHLQKRKIHFRRIDGASSLPARNKTLEEFRKDNKIRILMMTTGTGAVGYVSLPVSFILILSTTIA
jgi:SNF2 family DNA or RNA helicase